MSLGSALPLSPDLLLRVRGEFREMPGLRLTTAQAARLFGLSAATCEAVLHALTSSGFLRCVRDEMFAIADSPLSQPVTP